jgi:hypothetical protein
MLYVLLNVLLCCFVYMGQVKVADAPRHSSNSVTGTDLISTTCTHH